MARTTPTRTEGGPDWNAHQRGGWVALWLWQGSRLTTKDVARLCNMTPQGAGKMMAILSAALPITVVEGKWQWIERDEGN